MSLTPRRLHGLEVESHCAQRAGGLHVNLTCQTWRSRTWWPQDTIRACENCGTGLATVRRHLHKKQRSRCLSTSTLRCGFNRGVLKMWTGGQGELSTQTGSAFYVMHFVWWTHQNNALFWVVNDTPEEYLFECTFGCMDAAPGLAWFWAFTHIFLAGIAGIWWALCLDRLPTWSITGRHPLLQPWCVHVCVIMMRHVANSEQDIRMDWWWLNPF